MKRFAALCVAASLLSGCVYSVFEAQPSATVNVCDERFVGAWRLLPADPPSNNDELFVIVTPGCKRWRFIDNGKDDANTENEVHVAFAEVAGKPLVTVKQDAKKDTNYASRDHQWSDGYIYLRYVFAEGSIKLYPADDKRIAHLIVDGKVKGRTETVTQSPASTRKEGEMHNFIAGNTDEMARVAQLDGVFSESRFFTLKPATTAEIFKDGKDPEHP
jgi:hypothetical protein